MSNAVPSARAITFNPGAPGIDVRSARDSSSMLGLRVHTVGKVLPQRRAIERHEALHIQPLRNCFFCPCAFLRLADGVPEVSLFELNALVQTLRPLSPNGNRKLHGHRVLARAKIIN